MKYLYKFTPEIILVLYVMIFLVFKSPEKSWDRVINSDGKGYYAYLPAIFIYHDLQFKFVEQYETQYYPSNRAVFKEFRNDAGTRKVDKYFPGMAVLWLPFFLFGHVMAWLEIYPMDGYSLPYQYSIALSALLFLWLGARWLKKLLKLFGSDESTAAGITFATILGTNLIFFTIVEPSMTHVYSFALITGFMYAVYHLFHHFHAKWFVRSLLAFTLVFLIRPTNGLVVILIPFIAGSRVVLKETFSKITSDKKTLLRGFAQALILLAVPLVLWYLQTGKWIVYSYGDEKLGFLHPHFLSILFSYNRGWFVYTPIAFVSMFGLAGLYRQNRFRFFWLLGFLLLFIYVMSCWWVWYYASKCGQRVFIDLYAIVGILLLFLFKSVKDVVWKQLLTVLVVLLVSLNLLQFYQHTQWIFPPYNITGANYRDSFFSLHRKAKVFIPDESVAAVKSFTHDMESDKGLAWMNERTRNNLVYHQGHWSSLVEKKIPYSVGLETRIDSLFTTANRVIRVSAWVLAPKDASDPTLVVDYQTKGKSVSYNQFILDKFVAVGKWTKIEAAYYVPGNLAPNSVAKIYFFNPSLYYWLYVDDLQIDFCSLRDEPDFRKIEGVLLPEKVNL